MREFTIGKNDAGQRLDRWLAKTLPLLPGPLAQKSPAPWPRSTSASSG